MDRRAWGPKELDTAQWLTLSRPLSFPTDWIKPPICQGSRPGDQGKAVIQGVKESRYSQEGLPYQDDFQSLYLGGDGVVGGGKTERAWQVSRAPLKVSPVSEDSRNGLDTGDTYTTPAFTPLGPHCTPSPILPNSLPGRPTEAELLPAAKHKSQISESSGFPEKGSSHWGLQSSTRANCCGKTSN